MDGFDRFEKLWADAGLLNNPTDPQASAGWAYLGPAPPTVEQFNSIEQWTDDRFNWLFGNIKNVIIDAGLTPTAPDLDGLLDALRARDATAPFVLRAGDSMTGTLSFAPVVGARFAPPTVPLFGTWNQNAIGFGWDGGALRVRMDDTDMGVIGLNVNAGAYVLKTGDTMTGNLALPTLLANGGVYPAFATAPEFALHSGAGFHYLQYFATGGLYAWQWETTTGTLRWLTPNGGVTSIDAAGNMVLSGNINSGGAVAAMTGVFPAISTNPNMVLSYANPFSVIAFGNNYYFRWNSVTGLLEWIAAGPVAFSSNLNGDFVIAGDFSAGRSITAGSSVSGTYLQSSGSIRAFADGVFDGIMTSGEVVSRNSVQASGPIYASTGTAGFGFSIAADPTGQGMNFTTGIGAYAFQVTANVFRWMVIGIQVASLDQGGSLRIDGNYYGLNANAPVSDERVKKNIQAYPRGLKDVIRLEPVSFQFNGEGGTPDDGKVWHGVIAQQAQQFVPECVRAMPDIIGAQTHGIPDFLGFDGSPLNYAYINCFKEIEARLTALEAGGRTTA